MSLPFAPGGVKIRLSGSQGSGEFGMIFHFNTGVIIDQSDGDMTTIANAAMNAWSTHITGLLADATTLKSVVVEGLNSATDGVGAWAGAVTGAASGDIPPAQVCVLQKDTIARRYRGGHPRHYWPSPEIGAYSDPTHLTNTAVVNWQTGVTAFIAEIVAALNALLSTDNPFYCNTSYFHDKALRSSPVQDPILGSSIESMVATQRRRVGR